jgi:hypothetical protein
MADTSPSTQAQVLLARLVELHHRDELAPDQHAALVRRLTAAGALVAKPANGGEQRRRGRKVIRFASFGAGLSLVAASWALWVRSVPISPEPVTHRRNDTTLAQNQPVHPKPCVVARGDYSKLWDAGSAGFEAPSEDGRFGGWVHFRDVGSQGRREPVQVVLLESAGATRYALRVEGPATPGWGAKLSVGMRARTQSEHGAHLECYDASAYRGLRFRASGTGIVQIVLQTAESIPVELGGKCTEKCWFSSSHAVALGATFRDFEIPWHQFGPDRTEATVVPKLMMVDFVIQATDAPYSLTLEDVSFMVDPQGP